MEVGDFTKEARKLEELVKKGEDDIPSLRKVLDDVNILAFAHFIREHYSGRRNQELIKGIIEVAKHHLQEASNYGSFYDGVFEKINKPKWFVGLSILALGELKAEESVPLLGNHLVGYYTHCADTGKDVFVYACRVDAYQALKNIGTSAARKIIQDYEERHGSIEIFEHNGRRYKQINSTIARCLPQEQEADLETVVDNPDNTEGGID